MSKNKEKFLGISWSSLSGLTFQQKPSSLRRRGSAPFVGANKDVAARVRGHEESSKMKSFSFLSAILPAMALACGMAQAHATSLPDPVLDAPLQQNSAEPGKKLETLVVAGGCFWGMQAVFQHVKGVETAISGYAGGSATTAIYEVVSTGATGHAESVQVTYDPTQVTLGQILKVYFSVAHDPTELDHQGPDYGTQYRSTIFFSNAEQEKIARAYIAQLDGAKVFSAPIVTTLEPLHGFYAAESYHQDYAKLHPENPYIAVNDLPKVAALEKELPQLFVK